MRKMQNARAIVKYPGAKWRIADWIIEYIPEHKSYLEPFCGSAAVFFKKPPSKIETINDLDGEIVNLFECVRRDPQKLGELVALTPYAREEYDNTFTAETADPYERARLYLIKTWMGHGFRICYKSGWKNDIAGREYAYAVRYWNQLPEWIMQACTRLKQAQIEHKPALEVITRFNRPEVLIYADPPYLLETRKLKKQYAHEMEKSEHIALLESLLQHKGPVILSGYDSELYNSMLPGWHKEQMDTTAEKGIARVETIWMNFTPQFNLFDFKNNVNQ